MNITRDIKSLSAFKQNASKLVKQVQETKQPLVLTVNGKPAAVVQDPDSYQQMIESREYNETVKVLRERMADMDNPEKWLSHEEAFERIRKKHNIERG